MRLPTQILLLGAILTNGARANDIAPDAAPAAPAPEPTAATGEVVQLDPVRVTADLWETPLEKIPASVSVYDGALLEAAGVRHFGDIVDQIPNVTWAGGTARPRYFQIRGIGENSQFEGETPDSAVVFKIDDLDFTGLGGVGSTFDVRQVEVLRGPQAGAFGANAAGGVIRIVTNDPTPDYTGFAQATIGSDNLREVGAAAGGTLTPDTPEKLMFRLAVQHAESDGFLRNVTLDSPANPRDEDMVRLKLTWNPNELWRWDATLFWSQQDNGYDEFSLDNNGRFTYSDYAGRDEQRSLAGSVRGVYSGLDDAVFTTVTTVSGANSVYSYDSDWTAWSDVPAAGPGYEGYLDLRRERRTGSQELRLDSKDESDAWGWIDRWTLGAYFARLEEDSRLTNFYDDNSFTGVPAYSRTRFVGDNAALFAQIGHDFSPSTRLTIGLRGEHVRQRTRVDSDGDGAVDFTARFNDTFGGGKITLEHEFSPRHLVFVSTARGYKSGGANVDLNIDPAVDPLTFDTEYLWNQELGWRASWFDSALTTELTAFYLIREDAQFRGSEGVGGDFRFYTDNGNGAYVRGVEGAFTQRLGGGWSLRGSFALMDSERESYRLPSGTLRPSRETNSTPGYGFSATLAYRAGARGLFGEVGIHGRDDYYESESHDERRRSFEIVNASLGYRWERWSVVAWVRNVFDETYEKRVFYFGNVPPAWTETRYVSFADPRTVGVTAEYRF
jgi:Outer membrane receptor proteins, mostly Fe transport